MRNAARLLKRMVKEAQSSTFHFKEARKCAAAAVALSNEILSMAGIEMLSAATLAELKEGKEMAEKYLSFLDTILGGGVI